MKSKINILGFLLGLSLISCSTAKILPDKINQIRQKIESENFTIQVNYANPLRGSQIYLTSDYDLKIKNDSAYAYLPYFGVAFVAPYGSSEGGIQFKKPVSDYKMKPMTKDKGWNIHFQVKSEYTTYNFSIQIFSNGQSDFTVTSFDKDAISFSGALKDD
jgi:hypothetical protein